ncbi:unnamed protein product [Urochloa decumbens]|uniref:Uncharacterized protein n=1 Tax=Urochloa decumbens TaxID=240449 RepID=A0ABC9GZY6_9POAL
MSSTKASSSSCAAAAETVVGSHVLTIHGYSKTKEALGVGVSVESERFLVGGHSWYIECYPCGFDEEAAGWVSVFLCLDHHHHGAAMDGEVQARCKFVLLNHAGETFFEAPLEHQVLTFCRASYAWGHDIIKITELEELCLLKDCQDFVRIRCDVTVIREPHPGDTHRDLGDLLANQEAGRDVTFEVGGEQFTAHRCVLAARSTVFMAELFGGPGKLQQNAANTSHIRVQGMEPKVFKAMLHFIYTDSLPEVDEGDDSKVAMAQGLLAAADRYKLERLKMVCGDMLCSYIDADTAVTTLQLAHKHGCHGLKEACAKFLKDVLANAGLVCNEFETFSK